MFQLTDNNSKIGGNIPPQVYIWIQTSETRSEGKRVTHTAKNTEVLHQNFNPWMLWEDNTIVKFSGPL